MSKRKMVFNFTDEFMRAIKISPEGGGRYVTEMYDHHGSVRETEHCNSYQDALEAAQDMIPSSQ